MANKNNYILNTFKLLQLDNIDIINVYFYAIAAGLISLGLPLGIQAIIGFVMAAQLSTSLMLLIGLVVLATFFYGLFQINQLRLIEKIKQKIFVRLSLAFDDKLDKLDVQRNREYQLAELMNRFFDTLTFQKSLSKLLIEIPTSTIQILLGLVLLSFYHPLFILFGIFLLVTLYLLIRFTGVQGMQSSIEESNHKYKLVHWIEQQAEYIKEVRSGQFAEMKQQRTNKILTDYTEARNEHFRVLNIQYWALTFFKVVLTAVMLFVGSYLLIEQLINIGQFVAAEIVIILLLSAIEKMIFGLDNVYDLFTATKKLFDVLDLPQNNQTNEIGQEIITGHALRADNITLQNEDGRSILNGVSFSLSQGDIFCVSGKSGSGKSTLINILAGLYTNYQGRVTIDDIVTNEAMGIRSSDFSSVHFLESGLLETSVLENISLNRQGINLSNIILMAKKLNFHHEISSLPNGYQTMVMPHKSNIPRQIQQLILLLRVMMRPVSIYIFEEPFAGLQDDYVASLTNFWQKEWQHKIIIYSTQNKQYDTIATTTLELPSSPAGFLGNTKSMN